MATTLPLALSPFSMQKPLPSFSVRCCEDANGRPSFNQKHDGVMVAFPEKNSLQVPPKVMPPRPRRIILVRHGESEGNVDESAYSRVADPKIELTEKGKVEAKECGKRIREMIEKDGVDDWKVYFYVSPYRRTLQTLRLLARAFGRSRIAGVREEPRLREQDFGILSFSQAQEGGCSVALVFLTFQI